MAKIAKKSEVAEKPEVAEETPESEKPEKKEKKPIELKRVEYDALGEIIEADPSLFFDAVIENAKDPTAGMAILHILSKHKFISLKDGKVDATDIGADYYKNYTPPEVGQRGFSKMSLEDRYNRMVTNHGPHPFIPDFSLADMPTDLDVEEARLALHRASLHYNNLLFSQNWGNKNILNVIENGKEKIKGDHANIKKLKEQGIKSTEGIQEFDTNLEEITD